MTTVPWIINRHYFPMGRGPTSRVTSNIEPLLIILLTVVEKRQISGHLARKIPRKSGDATSRAATRSFIRPVLKVDIIPHANFSLST